MRNSNILAALKLAGAALLGATVGYAVAWLLNALFLVLCALLGKTLGFIVYCAASIALVHFGARYLLRTYLVIQPSARGNRAYAPLLGR